MKGNWAALLKISAITIHNLQTGLMLVPAAWCWFQRVQRNQQPPACCLGTEQHEQGGRTRGDSESFGCRWRAERAVVGRMKRPDETRRWMWEGGREPISAAPLSLTLAVSVLGERCSRIPTGGCGGVRGGDKICQVDKMGGNAQRHANGAGCLAGAVGKDAPLRLRLC